MDMLRRAYRCISSGAIPSQQSTSGSTTDPAPSSGVAADEADDSSYYHSYSCDDLYLSADGPRGADAGQLHQPDEPEVFSPGPEEVPFSTWLAPRTRTTLCTCGRALIRNRLRENRRATAHCPERIP